MVEKSCGEKSSGVEWEGSGPGKAVVEMEQPCSGVDMEAGGPGKAVVEINQPCSGMDMEETGGPGKVVEEMHCKKSTFNYGILSLTTCD